MVSTIMIIRLMIVIHKRRKHNNKELRRAMEQHGRPFAWIVDPLNVVQATEVVLNYTYVFIGRIRMLTIVYV